MFVGTPGRSRGRTPAATGPRSGPRRGPLLDGAFRLALAAVVALWLAPPVTAQHLPFLRYTTDDGLAATQVWHVFQDSRGLLWISTTWGLNRFDGESFQTLTVNQGLPSPTVRLTIEDDDGTIWIGTNAGLVRFDGVALTSLTERGGAFAATVWSAAKDRNGALWFGTEKGLLSLAGGTFHTYTSADGLASDYVYGLSLTRDGAVWVGSRGAGVSRCTLEPEGRLGHCRVFTRRDGLAGEAIHAIAEGADGTLYFATRDGGLSRFDGAAFRNFTRADGLPSDDLYALLVRERELLVATDDGLGICRLPELAPCRVLREENGLPDNGVRALLEDAENRLWIGAEGGLARLERHDLYSYGRAEGLPDGHVYAIAADGTGGVWIGTFTGLTHLEIGPDGEPSMRSWSERDGLASHWVWSILRDRSGALWIGTERGLSRRGPGGGFRSWRRAEGLASEYLAGLLEDRNGVLWIAASDGVIRVERDAAGDVTGFRRFDAADGLPLPRANALAEDPLGRLWVAHSEALSYFDGERFHVVGRESGLASTSTRSFGVDRAGDLWVGGQGQVARLLRGDPGAPPRFEPLDTRGALDDYLVLAIAESDRGELLVGTNRGVLTLARKGRTATVVARFDRTTGAVASEISHSSAFARDARGRFWFGFKGGASVFLDPSAAPPPGAAPRVVFERLALGSGADRRVPFRGGPTGEGLGRGADTVRLPTHERSFRVEVRPLSLAPRESIRYQFRLDGLERDWTPERPEAAREFVRLDPGDYRLEARARFVDGEWGEPARLELALAPAWYETAAARAAALAATIAALAAAFALRSRRAGRRNRALAAEVAARTDDLARYTRALEENVEALGHANERIRLADRHRGEFLAKMSHELRAPLTSVLGFAALLHDGLEERIEPRYLRYLRNIRESGNHLLRLINNLLDQAKIEAGRMDLHLERASVDVVVESAVALVEGFAATREVALRVAPHEPMPPVTVDVAKLRQIVVNLLSNAIKFAPGGSEIGIAVRLVGGDEAEPEAYELAVEDRGPGVAPADRERVFEPFRQLAGQGREEPGTGLGLPIVRQFAEMLGGSVGVHAREGGGARFTVTLPVEAVDTTRVPWSSPVVDVVPADVRHRRVLVVEPDRGRFTALAAHLDRRGFLAVRAPDAEEGLRMIRELEPAVVAVDVDPARPEAWGVLVALDRGHARTGVPRVLYAFGSGSERGIALGFDRAFVGPAPARDLAEALVASATSASHDSRAASHSSHSSDSSHGAAGGPGRKARYWIAAPSAEGLEPALAGAELCVRPARIQALAEAAAGGFAAALVALGAEPGDGREPGDGGGVALALAAQEAVRVRMGWVGLLAPALDPGERRRLREAADDAQTAAGQAIAAAVERLVGAAS